MLTLITGGARSGKSTFAQSLCGSANKVAYVATARVEDAEMAARIQRHQASRSAEWLTIEEPLYLSEAVREKSNGSDIVLVDCLTVWLSNLLHQYQACSTDEAESRVKSTVQSFIDACEGRPVIAVTNEVGAGIVPMQALARQFRDLQGMINQQVATQSETVYLVTCGIPLRLKG